MKNEMHYAKVEFYKTLVKQTCFVDSELEKLIAHSMQESGFYELCKMFADIGLNAPKQINGLNVQAVFQFSDIETAKTATVQFCKKHNVQDIDSLLLIIEVMHPFAIDDDDSKIHSGVVLNDNNNASMGLFGVYYIFQKLPNEIWEKVSDEIKSMWQDM